MAAVAIDCASAFSMKAEDLTGIKQALQKIGIAPSSETPLEVALVEIDEVSISPSTPVAKMAIRVGDTLYHFRMLFVEKKPIKIEFTFKKVTGIKYQEKKILGQTKFKLPQLDSIGSKLIELFGTYHRIFWNCEGFVSCFLDIICDSNYEPVTTITNSERLRAALFVGINTKRTSIPNEASKTEVEIASDTVISTVVPITEEVVKSTWLCIIS